MQLFNKVKDININKNKEVECEECPPTIDHKAPLHVINVASS